MSRGSFTCRTCGSSRLASVTRAAEQMFGTLEPFDYLECGDCGCLQIETVPSDLDRFYPQEGYYSLAAARESRLALAVKRVRARHARGDATVVGGLVERFYPLPELPAWFTELGLAHDEPILDVGCGVGQFLLSLRNAGYTSLRGVDPFLAGDIRYGGGIEIRKAGIEEVEGIFSLVTMLDVFEHVPNQLEVLETAGRLIGAEGRLVVRMPVVAWAWREYRENWVQLDAPRHLVVHTKRSFEQLAECAGLAISSATDVSSGFQFWGSEQYRRGITFMSPTSVAIDPADSVFSPEQLSEFEQRADELNAAGEGDTACFVLRRQS